MSPGKENGNFHENFTLRSEQQIVDTLDCVKDALASSGITLLASNDETKRREQQLRKNPLSQIDDSLEFQLFYCLGIGSTPSPVTVTFNVFGDLCSIGVSVSHHLQQSYSNELDLLRTNIGYAIQEGQKRIPNHKAM